MIILKLNNYKFVIGNGLIYSYIIIINILLCMNNSPCNNESGIIVKYNTHILKNNLN